MELLFLAACCIAAFPEVTCQAQEDADSSRVIVYHAGSLNAAFNNLSAAFTAKTGIPVEHRGFGAVEAARRATVGGEPVDVYATVDHSNIDLFLKPDWADYSIRFATGAEVLAYTTESRLAGSIADPNGPAFDPPSSIPDAAPDWRAILLADSVRIGGSDPNVDPGGYRALMVMQLAERLYGIPGGGFQKKYAITRAGQQLGTDYDYSFYYEHSARNAKTNPNYRYVRLPDAVDLSDPANENHYNRAGLVISGLAPGDPPATVRGTAIVFGVTVLKRAPHPREAVSFLEFMFSAEGMALQKAAGIDPIAPVASPKDAEVLPVPLRNMVTITR